MKSTGTAALQTLDIRSDQCGIRTKVFVEEKLIKFEIVLKERIALANPKKRDRIAGAATLTRLDIATSKKLANSDRGLDMGMHCRDAIDLAMLHLNKTEFSEAATKSKAAYGEAILKDLAKVRLGEARRVNRLSAV